MKLNRYFFYTILIICLAGNVFAQTSVKTIFLVRHAEKADDGTRDPSLNEAGSSRSQNLANMLSAADIEFIYSTDFKRTIETGMPLAIVLGKEIIKYDPPYSSAVEKILKDTGDSRVLIIGHSNTIPALVNRLIEEEKYSQLDENEYDNLFIVTLSGESSDCVVIKF